MTNRYDKMIKKMRAKKREKLREQKKAIENSKLDIDKDILSIDEEISRNDHSLPITDEERSLIIQDEKLYEVPISIEKIKTKDKFEAIKTIIKTYEDGIIITSERELEPLMRGRKQIGYTNKGSVETIEGAI